MRDFGSHVVPGSISIPLDAFLAGAKTFTVEGRVAVGARAFATQAVLMGSRGAGGIPLKFMASPAVFGIFSADTLGGQVSTAIGNVAAVYDGTPHHWALVRDYDANRHALYFDGELVASATQTNREATLAAGQPTRIGIDPGDASVSPGGLMAIRDVRVWSTARTQEQIRANMAPSALRGDEQGLVAWYPLDQDAKDYAAGVGPLPAVDLQFSRMTTVPVTGGRLTVPATAVLDAWSGLRMPVAQDPLLVEMGTDNVVIEADIDYLGAGGAGFGGPLARWQGGSPVSYYAANGAGWDQYVVWRDGTTAFAFSGAYAARRLVRLTMNGRSARAQVSYDGGVTWAHDQTTTLTEADRGATRHGLWFNNHGAQAVVKRLTVTPLSQRRRLDGTVVGAARPQLALLR